MAGTFGAIGFKERGRGGGQGIPVWSKGGNIVIKHIPGANKNVIQKIGTKLPTLAMPVRVTAAQLTSLYGVVGTTASLVFHFETVSATLEAIDGVEEYFHGQDAYTAVLHFIRSSGDFAIASTSFLTEGGDVFISEAGDTFIQE